MPIFQISNYAKNFRFGHLEMIWDGWLLQIFCYWGIWEGQEIMAGTHFFPQFWQKKSQVWAFGTDLGRIWPVQIFGYFGIWAFGHLGIWAFRQKANYGRHPVGACHDSFFAQTPKYPVPFV